MPGRVPPKSGNTRSCDAALRRVAQSLSGKPVFVGYPAGFDFLFVYWYLIRFAGESPFSFFSARHQDLRHGGLKKGLPQEHQRTECQSAGSTSHPHTHIALDDAIEQGALFCNMLAENLRDSKE